MSSISPEVLKFIKKSCLLLVPVSLFLGVSVFFLIYSGELVPIDRVIAMRVKAPEKASMYGCLYSSPKLYYQWQVALKTGPKIIALGTSRNQELRAEFFSRDASFYNAASSASKLFSYKYFLNSIPRGREPEVVILGLDQFFFNPNWDFYSLSEKPEDAFAYKTDYAEILKLGVPGVHRDLIRNGLPANFTGLRRSGRLGLNAILDNYGLRKDGSLSLNTGKIKASRHNDALRFAESGRHSFEFSSEVSTQALAQLDGLLGFCRDRGIYVVAFFPPYAHCVYETMMSMGEKHSYIPKLRAMMPGIFKKYSFGFYDFSDLKDTGASDMETIDGYHGSEKAYLRLFVKMSEREPELKKRTDIPYLKARLAASTGDFTVFGE